MRKLTELRFTVEHRRSVSFAMAAWGKACRVAVRAGAASFRQQGLPGAESHLSNGLACSVSQQTRGMASGTTTGSDYAETCRNCRMYLTDSPFCAGGHHGREITYEGLTLHAPATWHTYVGKGMCGIMW